MKVIIVCKSTPLRNLSLNGEILRRGMAQSPASVLGGTSKVNLEHLEIRTFLFFSMVTLWSTFTWKINMFDGLEKK